MVSWVKVSDPYETRLAGQSEGGGSGRVRSGGFSISRVGSGQNIFKSHGSGRVGSAVFKIWRVVSGQEVLKSRGSGRVKSAHLQIFVGWVESGQLTRPDRTREVGPDPRKALHKTT